ncbi:beta-propeller fold lactonase family protein [Actinospica durhamensis]|uniref:Beta-propeller fold lactonase family protein n=1 Tax=Actinospica durhamensis TaxID=1508375 RepID=A0A941ERQ0_9ACTN|nr:YncE family protein [Actinospica durhamensis]MBR7836792.1 beta-propeller fold lactonase family protein [Actinospica durhamensis]
MTAQVPGSPTALTATADGRWAFASVSHQNGGEIAVMAVGAGALRLVRTIALPGSMHDAFGMTLTHDGRFLLAAGYTATAVMNVAALEDGRGDPVAGVLSDGGAGQFEVEVSKDDRYAYVSDETTGGVSVFDLSTALRHGFASPGVALGIVPLASGAVGMALSPDGTLLYATTLGDYGPHGQLWVVNTAEAEKAAGSSAVVSHANAGCQPVRVAVSPDGGTVWVTALQSNALLAFSTTDLERDPNLALRAVVRVGSEPVGLALADDGRVALVGDSDRGLVAETGSSAPQTVSVIDTAAALAHRPASLGTVAVGVFPRDIGIDPANGEVLLADYGSGTVEAFPAPSALTLG